MYTEEEVELLREKYLNALDKKEVIDLLATELDKSKKSIIGKLSREGIYEKQVYHSKTGELPVTKKELVARIAEATGADIERIQGLEKSPKTDLKNLLQCLK